jgi:hypothetical protein
MDDAVCEATVFTKNRERLSSVPAAPACRAVPPAPASDNGRLRHVGGHHGRDHRRRRAFMLTTLS